MAPRITPHLITLCYDAAVSSFWRKSALRLFLTGVGIGNSYLATWAPEETKRAFLSRMFAELRRNKRGQDAILLMARALAEQREFPDLQHWDDATLKTQQAHAAVGALRRYLANQDDRKDTQADNTAAQERRRILQEQAKRSRDMLDSLSTRLAALSLRLGEQRAGYEFQDWFFDFLEFYEVTCRRPYVVDGRQIDGSLTISETTYLLELKFTSHPAGAEAIDTFYKKVITKADNTMGVMVSVAGYSSVAKQEASGVRPPSRR